MTDSELIDALGGTNEAARKLGTTKYCVSGWRRRGIPARVRLANMALFRTAARKVAKAKA